MKIIQVVLLFVFLIYINASGTSSCEDENGNTYVPSSADDCKKRLTEDEKKNLYSHCCMIKYEHMEDDNGNKISASCGTIRQAQFDKIKDYVKYQTFKYGLDGYEIDCKSFYINISILILIFLFI